MDLLRGKNKGQVNGSETQRSPVGPEASIEWVTPALAAEWLETMGANRSVSDAHVAKLRRDMEADRWYVTSQGIGFDSNGQLIEGQHRCWAILQCGKSIQSLVVRGIDPAAQAAMDENRKRTFSDDLKIANEPDYSSKASMTRMVLKFETGWIRGLTFSTTRTLQFNRYELAETFEDMVARADTTAAIRAGGRWQARHGCPISAGSAAHFLGQVTYGKPFVDDFFYRVQKGVELAESDPEKALTERFRIEDKQKPKAASELYLTWILKALRAAYEGKSLRKVEFKGRIPKELPQL